MLYQNLRMPSNTIYTVGWAPFKVLSGLLKYYYLTFSKMKIIPLLIIIYIYINFIVSDYNNGEISLHDVYDYIINENEVYTIYRYK